MNKSERNPKGAGRKKIEGGIKREVIATPEEFKILRALLKEIRTNKTK